MKILTSSLAISDEIARQIRECESCQIAVAWASNKFDCYESLVQNKSKIERIIVGLHFAQTHPDFIQAFLNDVDKVRFVHNCAGVFHPKVYLFKHREGWDCLVGSPNFTKGAFTRNTETAVLINHEDVGAEVALAELIKLIDGYWVLARALTEYELDEYRTAWKKGRKRRMRVQRATEAKLHSLLPRLLTELSASAFNAQVLAAIERLPEISDRWKLGKAGETLSVRLRKATEAVVQLIVFPKDNRCSLEVMKHGPPEVRERIAESLRTHLGKFQSQEVSQLSKGGTVVHLHHRLDMKQILMSGNIGAASSQRDFRDEVLRVIKFFKYLDHALTTWSAS